MMYLVKLNKNDTEKDMVFANDVQLSLTTPNCYNVKIGDAIFCDIPKSDIIFFIDKYITLRTICDFCEDRGVKSDEYERAYQRGLEDAWDAAQKISQYTWDWHTVCECFPENRGQSYALIFGSNTAREAINKIKEYEEKIKQPRDDTRPYYANEWTPQDSFKPQKSEERA